MATELVENTTNILIETPSGFEKFTHISKTWYENIISLTFSDGSILRGSLTHRIKLASGQFEYFASIRPGAKISKTLTVVDHSLDTSGDYLYDLLNVENGNQYLTGSVISHNCEFISSDALLISSMKLLEMRHTPPISEDMGFKFWEPIRSDTMYLVGADIATGAGKDFSVIEVFEFPSLVQVAEWRSNILIIPELYVKLKWIVNKLCTPRNNKRSEVFWTFERNGVGEAVAALYNTDDNPPEFADLVNDVQGKYGMQTTNRNKVLACLQLKTLLEKVKNGLTINSEINIFELKNFIATGGGYAAKQGATDDSISALLLIVRLLKHVAEFDESARKKMYEYEAGDFLQEGSEDGETDEPIPFFIS